MLFTFHGDPMTTRLGECVNLVELTEEFGSDEKCRTVLEQLRWPNGPVCPRCQARAAKIADRFQYICNSCHYQFSVTTGTIFHGSHLSLWKWLLAVYLMVKSKKGISASQLKRMLRTGNQAAWYLCHRIRKAMAIMPLEPVKGVVEVDNPYIRGKGRHVAFGYRANTMVLGAVQRGEPARPRAERRKPSKVVLCQLIEEQGVSERDARTTIMTIGNPACHGANRAGITHSVLAAYHQVSAKHLGAYLDESEWLLNNRANRFLFRDTLLRLIACPNLEYKALIKGPAALTRPHC
jgi:transposase-like protein